MCCVIVSPSSAHPFINLGELEFPQPPDLVRRQALAFAPAVHGVLHHAQMPGNIDGGTQGSALMALAFKEAPKSFSIVISLAGGDVGDSMKCLLWPVPTCRERPSRSVVVRVSEGAIAPFAKAATRAEMSQAQAAKLLGVTQPRVSDLMRGKINLFGLDALVNMATAAGLHIDMRVTEAA